MAADNSKGFTQDSGLRTTIQQTTEQTKPMSTAAQRCAFHEQRPAFARCMSCAKMLCRECATQWDGIWHCAACLGAQRTKSVERSPLLGWIAVLATSTLLLYATARLMVWLGASIAGWF